MCNVSLILFSLHRQSMCSLPTQDLTPIMYLYEHSFDYLSAIGIVLDFEGKLIPVGKCKVMQTTHKKYVQIDSFFLCLPLHPFV